MCEEPRRSTLAWNLAAELPAQSLAPADRECDLAPLRHATRRPRGEEAVRVRIVGIVTERRLGRGRRQLEENLRGPERGLAPHHRHGNTHHVAPALEEELAPFTAPA